MRLALLIVVGCYAPSPPEGVVCDGDQGCPAPMQCFFGKCAAEPPPCLPIATGNGQLTAPLLDHAIVLDGDLADWPTCFVDVDPTTAGLVRDLGTGGMYSSGRFSVAADAGHIYVAAEVHAIPPLGDQPAPGV